MGAITSTITQFIPEITIVSLIAGILIFLILLPFIILIWGNITFVGQVLTFIAGLWIASIFTKG